MKLIKFNLQNEPYYSKQFIAGFKHGALRQYEADKQDTISKSALKKHFTRLAEDICEDDSNPCWFSFMLVDILKEIDEVKNEVSD